MKNETFFSSGHPYAFLRLASFLSISVLAFSCTKESSVSSAGVTADDVSVTAYDLTNSLPSGYVKDGTVDYTKYIQQGINKYDNVNFPPFPVMVSDVGLQLRSNTVLTFKVGSSLILKPSSNANYDVISIRECNNVTLNYPVVLGDRKNHKGTGGEWGMGIGIYASQNIVLKGPVVKETWGDGIYVGANASNVYCSNITIDRPNINSVRRNGIGITSVKGIKITNGSIYGSNGTIPQDGICVEPNGPKDEVSGIEISNTQTLYNKGYGIEFSLSKIYGGSNKTVNAVVNNHVDKGSLSAAYISCYSNKSSDGERVYGSITFNQPSWYNFGEYVWRPYGLQENNLALKVVGPSLYDNSNKLISQSATLSMLKREVYPGAKVSINF